MTEKDKEFAQGPKALREEAIVERNGTILFHKFYLQHKNVSGYPVYDRELLHSELKNAGKVTLIEMQRNP
jgi:hypothetical protein